MTATLAAAATVTVGVPGVDLRLENVVFITGSGDKILTGVQEQNPERSLGNFVPQKLMIFC